MKPPPFDYVVAEDLDHALEALRTAGDDAKVLAGGQSLMTLLNLRLAQPSVLVDLNRVARLGDVRVDGDNLHIGAMVRYQKLETSQVVARHLPVLAEATSWIAHPQVRARGTVGGSLAHADAAAEMPVIMVALEATVTALSTRGERSIPVHELIAGNLISTLEPDEVLTAVKVPLLPTGTGSSFCEFARRHGDYAIGGAVAVVTVDGDGRCLRARVCLLGHESGPLRSREAEDVLLGSSVTAETAAAAARAAVQSLRCVPNIHGSADYRRNVVRAMTERAIRTAAERARSQA